MEDCKICDGEDHDCDECSGDGIVGEICKVCNGEGVATEPNAQQIDRLKVDRYYYELVRDHLPNAEYVASGEAPIQFRFTGGDGLLMPLSSND